MVKAKEIYKCPICGNVVEILYAGGGQLVCCGKPMILQKENADDKASKEKHVPILEKTKDGFKVKVGTVEHPMLPEHYIQWIELIADGNSFKKFLKPGEKPEAEFCIKAKQVSARAYCNLHGLWKSN